MTNKSLAPAPEIRHGSYEQIKGYVGFEDDNGNIAIGGLELLDLARYHDPFPVYRMIAARRMMAVGVEGDLFNEHDEDSGCQTAGCVSANSDEGNLARYGRLID